MAISQKPRGDALLVAGNFNTNLSAPEGWMRDEEITADLAAAGLEYMSGQFPPQKKLWLKDSRTWCMRRRGREVRSRTDYILVIDLRLLQNVTFRDELHNTDHYLVLGCLYGAAPAAHSQYLGKRKRFPIKPPPTLDRINRLFTELRGAITKPTQRGHLRQVWISPETWRLIDTRIAARQNGDQHNSRALSRTIKDIIQEDQCRRVAEAGSAVESLHTSDTPLIQEAWIRIGWYKDTVDRPLAPSRVAIATMMAERVELYRNVPLPGQPIPAGVQPLPVDDTTPKDADIAWAVRRLFRNRSGGPSGMRAEHLRQRLIATTWEDIPDATNWLKVVAIVQAALFDGMLDGESKRQTVDLIPKGKIGDFREIGLVEVMWKTATNLLNHRLTTATNLHNVLNRFRTGQGTGTAALEAKLLQQLTSMREVVIFKIFLDLQKAYDALDWDTCLEILAAYGVRVGPRTIRLLRTYWERLTIVARDGG